MTRCDNIIQSIILILFLSLVDGNTIIPYREKFQNPIGFKNSEQLIPKFENFNMHHSFSISSSLTGNNNHTIGTYSNIFTYKLSENFTINSALHLTQNNNTSYVSNSSNGIGYQLGFEYKLSPNSIISFQFINLSNSYLLNDK